MTPTDVFHLRALDFTCGARVNLPRTGVVVVVGPNNVGKTTMLAELQNWMQNGVLHHNNKLEVILKGIEFSDCDGHTMGNWLKGFESPNTRTPESPNRASYRNWHYRQHFYDENFTEHDMPFQARRSELRGFLLCSGASASFNGPTPDFYQGHMEHDNRQFVDMYNSPELVAKVSELSKQIFGEPVSMSRAGSTSALHYGQLPHIDTPPTEEQREALLTTPKVLDQGQGVVTFLNLAITLELGQEPLVILDEPDAHLHPPQAYRAGHFIAQRGKRSQVLVITHSLEFLHGIIDSGAPVTVIRLDRDRLGMGTVSVLPAQELKKHWTDVAIRYSGCLSGLFHKGVVLCEGSGDCRYFNIALDHHTAKLAPHDLHFVDAGGKSGMKKLAASLRAMVVPTSCILDFDALRNWNELSSLIETLGGNPEPLKADWTVVSHSLNQKSDGRRVRDVLHEIEKAIGDPHSDYSAEKSRLINELSKRRDGWSEAKKHGLDALSGQANVAARTMLESLSGIGIHVLPWGELEGLHRDIQGHGPAFVSQVIERRDYERLGPDQIGFILGIRTTTAPVRTESADEIANLAHDTERAG